MINVPRTLKHLSINQQERLKFTASEAQAIFNSALDDICAAISRNKTDHPYITGGLACNPYCQARIKQVIPNVEIVEDPHLAVCKYKFKSESEKFIQMYVSHGYVLFCFN